MYLTITGVQNNDNRVFTISGVPLGRFELKLNGLTLSPDIDYSMSNAWTILFVAPPQPTDKLLAIADGSRDINPPTPKVVSPVSGRIMVRANDQNGDPMRGAGLGSFIFDQAAVAQIIAQTILLLQGEWFESLSTGTPLFQKILGVPTTSYEVSRILRQRILGCPFVTGIQALEASFGPAGRTFTFVALVQTSFGVVTVTNQQLTGVTWQSLSGVAWQQLTGVRWQ